MDVELLTTPEVIDELSGRATFAGILIHSNKEAKNCPGGATLHGNWDITYCKLTNEQVADLLEDAVAHFRQLAETENE